MSMPPVSFKVGSFNCTILCDSKSDFTEQDVLQVFGEKAERVLAAFHALPSPQPMCSNILYIDSGNHHILIDAGLGNLDPNDPGTLMESLREANLSPDSIDLIALSHFHLDHIGGLLDAEGKVNFPNARLVAPKIEYEHWMNEKHLAEMDQSRAEILKQRFDAYADRLTLLDAEAEIVPGLCYLSLSGHTPGHSGIVLESQGERLLHFVDTLHGTIQMNAVDEVPRFDAQPDVAIATRRAALERAASENALTMTYHFTFPGIGHVRHTADGYTWEPMSNIDQ